MDKMDLNVSEFDLIEGLNQCCWLFETQANGKGIKLTVEP